MQWQIEEFVFCEKQQTLGSNNNTVQLEPMLVELLSYFCRHTDQIISREQLIQQVWRGRFITDNAVTKVINKLRKHFDDDPRHPQFIATFPKKGYKFIADAVAISETAAPQTNNATAINSARSKPPLSKHSWALNVLLLLTALIVMIALLWPDTDSKTPIKTEVKALTRDAGKEAWPQVSPDGQYLAYMAFGEQQIHLWVKSLVNQQKIEISHGDNVGVGPASWSSDGKKLLYLAASEQSCQYFIREIDGLTLGEPTLIHNCPAGSYGRISFSHDDNMVIYSEAPDRHSPYSIFTLNLETGEKRRVKQPPLFLGGNSQFDLHPTENKLLISSPDKQQWEGFYSLDLDSDELTLLFKLNAYICCGIWDHSGTRVVLMGEHPSQQLLSYDLKGNDRQVVYSSSQQVLGPLRHSNGTDYLFRTGASSLNAKLYNTENTALSNIANSSVDDRLAVFSEAKQQIAYISLSTDAEEVWLTNPKTKQTKKLTDFNDGRRIVDLLWSYDGKRLAALGLNQIYLIDSESGQAKTLKMPEQEIRGLSFKDNQHLSFSKQTQQGWRVHYYDIEKDQLSYADPKWAYIRYAAEPNDILWQDQQGKLFIGPTQRPVVETAINSASLISGRQFNLQTYQGQWAWQAHIDHQMQLFYKPSLNTPTSQLLTTDSYHFDLSAAGLLFHSKNNNNADIYQTVSE